LTGYYLIEYEQNGNDRVKYGEKLLEEMAMQLKERGLKGFSLRALRDCRAFYAAYPQIRQTLSAELQTPEYKNSQQFANIIFHI